MSDSDLEKSPVSVKRARESSFDSNGAEQTSPPPIVATDPKDQVQMITDLQGQFLQDGSVAYLISKQWFTRWKQYCSRLSSSQQDARKIGEQTNPGPINNKSILTPEGKLIKDLVYNESVFAIPIQAWEKLVEW
jgi:ubiquitin carboxyl-terminal hydrolase 4/11/15